MDREYWTKKIRGFIARVEAGDAPAAIREIHVFGSFSRGALSPNDLDLFVIHDKPDPAVLASWREAAKEHYPFDQLAQFLSAGQRFDAAMRKVFRRGSERMDIKLGNSLKEASAGMVKLPRREVRLLWSQDDRDWQAKVAAIAPDAAAVRHPRNHFIEVKRTFGTLEDVEKVTQFIDDGVLSLKRTRADGIEIRLNPTFQERLDFWMRVRPVGADGMKLLPLAMWWVQEQGGKRPRVWERTEVGDEERQFHVQIGRLYPMYVYRLFDAQPQMIRHCLIPKLRAREENWMYEFERGPKWEERPRRGV